MRRKTMRVVKGLTRGGQRRKKGITGFLLFFIVWTMAGLVSGGFFFHWQVNHHEEVASAQDIRTEDNQALLSYIDQGIAAVSRGISQRRPPNGEPEDSISVFSGMIGAAYPIIAVVDPGEASEGQNQGQDGGQPASEKQESAEVSPNAQAQVKEQEAPLTKAAVVVSPKPVEKPKEMKIDENKPVVIIYHTHATESYLPVSDGNFHSVEEKATVREVGNALAAELQSQGIQVIHNKTLHDHPSYSQSYSRSLATIKEIMSSTKAPKIVIDLHRDAAGYTQNQALTTTVKDKKVAMFGFVVGTANTNAKELKVLAKYMIAKANEKYPGIARSVIEKPYKFNEYVSDYYMLLEVGNNQNQIEEAVESAKCFGKVLGEAIQNNFQ